MSNEKLFKVYNPVTKIWAGTYKTRKEAEKRLKEINDKDYIIQEI
jgi:hypothetical protein